MLNPRDPIIDGLEAQAGEILRLLRARTTRRPLIIEFSGSPKSGKTTAIGALSLFFHRNNFRVETFTEPASISPIANRKGHPDFNVWVSCASLQGLIESVGKDLDLFIFDRGLFDALVWNRLLARTGKVTAQEAETIEAFFMMDRWARLVDLVCVMKCDPATSIEREYANQLTRKRGTIMESGILKQLNQAMEDTLACCSPKFKNTFVVDTTSTSIRQGAIEIAQQTLSAIRKLLDESLCVLRRSRLPIELPVRGFSFDHEIAEAVVNSINALGEFLPRSKAEYDENYLIPIPCALVMFQERILILRRKEPGHDLHDTFAIWAGGHVMESDSSHQNIVLNCLRRELNEELLIQGECELRPIGIVRTDQNERASRHIGVVYTARLSNDHVALSLRQREFREKRGTSVSGTLIDISTLKDFFEKMGDWSKFIVKEMWPDQTVRTRPRAT
jgi:predicted NUDIX family phosphoesterase